MNTFALGLIKRTVRVVSAQFHNLALLGIERQHKHQQNYVKILNTLTVMVLVMLFAQLLLILILIPPQATAIISSSVIHIVLFGCVLRCSAKRNFSAARAVLMATYVSFVCWSSVLWPLNLHFQYLFLIALFVSPFLYQNWEQRQTKSNLVLYWCCYLILSIFWYHIDDSSLQNRRFQLLNDVLLFFAAAISSYLVHTNSQSALKHSLQENALASHLLNKTLPKPLLRQAMECDSEHNPSVVRHEACVLFADLQNYTAYCSATQDKKLVAFLEEFYALIDTICREFGIEKIKTNGDQYMAVCGTVGSVQYPAKQCCLAALAMVERCKELLVAQQKPLGIRIGLATGPVMAGFASRHELKYDVWGQTVNLASRMESTSKLNRIQVCKNTFLQCAGDIVFEHRGKINCKGLGTLDTYLISQRTNSDTPLPIDDTR